MQNSQSQHYHPNQLSHIPHGLLESEQLFPTAKMFDSQIKTHLYKGAL